VSKLTCLAVLVACGGGSNATPDALDIHDVASIDAVSVDDVLVDTALPDAPADAPVDVALDAAPACSNLLEGSIVIHNSLDVATLSGFCGVTGDVEIAAPGVTTMSLSTIASIGGSLAITNASDLTSLSLPVLTRAGGLDLENLPAVTSLSVPVLASVDNLRVALPAGISVSFPSLARSNGAITVASGGPVDLGALAIAAGVTVQSSNVDLHGLTTATQLAFLGAGTVSLPALTSAGGVGVTRTALSCPVLANVQTLDVVYDSDGAASIAVPALTTAAKITLSSNGSLVSATFAAPSLTSAVLDSHLQKGSTVSIDLHALATGTIWVQGATVTKLDLSALTTLATPPGAMGCDVSAYQGCAFFYADNTTSTSLAFPKLTGAASIWLDGDTGIDAVSMPVLSSVGSRLQIDTVPTITLPALTTVTGEIDLGLTALTTGPDPRLTSIDLSALRRAGTLKVRASIPVALPNLMSASLVSFDRITALDLPSFQMGSLSLLNSSVPGVTLPALTNASVLYFYDNALASISLPVVATASELTVDTDLSIQTIDAPVLSNVQGEVAFVVVPRLATLNLPKLGAVGGELRVVLTDLLALSLPMLTSVGPALYIGYTNDPNARLASLDLPNLTKLGPTNAGDAWVEFDPKLPQCLADQLHTQLIAHGFTGTFTTSGLAGTCP